MVQTTIFQGLARLALFQGGYNCYHTERLRHVRVPPPPVSVKEDPVCMAGSDRDCPLLLKITLWDEFHEEIRRDGKQRKVAWRIKQKHKLTEHGGILKYLDDVVREHHSHTKLLLQEMPHAFTVAKVLLNGPGFSPEQ
ncbi:hypothetical protein JVT61DRAFT_11 [Boletus reticuloceps]|uniref:Uncharacterized protein n=1 Tax=Boletus reticuloceps TaxID=495285 RepID=A0A8I2YZU2_9AGAM|nr:hypothetical protein JVT61DRAFT_11 [Boletus reticuloceps]